MRIAALIVLFGLGGLALVVSAAASPRFATTFALTYSSQAPGSPSGVDGLVTWSDPGESFGKPKEVKRIKLIFHPGTRLDTSALPVCRSSDSKVQRLSVRACPRSTILGSVKGEIAISNGQRFVPVATLFNARRAIIVVVVLNGRFLVNFRDDVRRGSLTINLKIPEGISLTRFEPHVPPHLKKRGKKRKAYMRTPLSCPSSGLWTTTAVFSYRDGSSQQLATTTPCRQP